MLLNRICGGLSFLALGFAFILVASSCSSSPPAGESGLGNPDASPDSSTSQSNADQVGSVPEDMLADEKGVESTGTSENPQASAADPFGDLKTKTNPEAQKSDLATASDDPFSDIDHSAPAAPSGSGKMGTYSVKAGDTLMKIAFSIYGDVDRWKDLHDLNQGKLKNSNVLRSGMKLRYEEPSQSFSPEQLSHSYLIKKGDTLAGIADDVYGKKQKYKKLQAFNKHLIKNPNRIFAGFTIFYDITEKEMAEAEARRAQKAAGGGGSGSVPSAIAPPPPPPAPSVANYPSASDSSAVPGPGAQQGPPAPTAH